MRILLVEDDQTLSKQITGKLKSESYVVDVAFDGEEGLYKLEEFPIDLAIVDLGLPELSGLELIRQARKKGTQTPILILTARNRWQEKVEGLEAGADDYMVKPFEVDELLARVRALIRRSGRWASATLTCGPFSLEPKQHVLTKNGVPIELTQFEFKVLAYLMLHAGEVVSKQTLVDHVYEEDQERDSNVMEVFIRRLRKKLDETEQLNVIETIRGRGYKFNIKRDV